MNGQYYQANGYEDYNSSMVFNNSNNNNYYDSYYNRYWIPRSDCSSSSIDTSDSSSPNTSRQLSYTQNSFYSQNYISPQYNNNFQSDYSKTSLYSEAKSQLHSSPISTNNETVDLKFNTEILPLIDAITNGDGSLKRRMRTAFTQEQRKYLLRVFEKQMYPTKEILEELSNKFNVTPTIIQVCFLHYLN